MFIVPRFDAKLIVTYSYEIEGLGKPKKTTFLGGPL